MKAAAGKRLLRLREDVYRANLSLVDHGLVVSTFGNVSGIDRELGLIAIKPSGVEYADLAPKNMVVLDLEGRKVEGDLNPSSDTRTHVRLYREFTDIGGIVHTHSRHATAWAQARRPLPCLGTTHADYFHGQIPCTDVISDPQIGMDYEEQTAVQIIDAFRKIDYRGMPAVLVASHGPFTWGRDAAEAVYHAWMLEYAAEMAAIAVQLNPRVRGIKRTLLDKHYLRKHGKNAYYGQEAGHG
ncbi:MAG: L-ribulose-5-phosphate 4-epimerase AraD [Spirochaetia bacterium]|jgi:L-ribulose-5-phosphate 4-epimerase